MSIRDAILRIGDGGTNWLDIIGPNSGWKLADPKWRPNVSQFKGGGSMSDSAQAEGQELNYKQFDNVVETIPLILDAPNPDQAMQTLRDALQIIKQAADYRSEIYENEKIWIEVKPYGENFLTGYSEIIKGSIAEYMSWGQPFVGSMFSHSVMENITLVIERKPFWQPIQPGEIIGPLYNFVDNPDFETWNFGINDSEPDMWTNLFTMGITGTNNRSTKNKFGNYALEIDVTGSTLTGAAKGLTQVISDLVTNTTYTLVCWVRNNGISNGVGRVLLNYSDQLELYRESTEHGWKLYVNTINTGDDATASINCEILTTGANTVGKMYFDAIMLLEGDWVEEAKNNLLPYMTGSHIVNHWDQPSGKIEEGDINWVDMWNVPGDVDALAIIEFQNNTVGEIESSAQYKRIRIGMRRTGDVFKFENYHDPIGIVDTESSSDSRIEITPTSEYSIITLKKISTIDITQHNFGRFRVLARLYDEKSDGASDLVTRIGYSVGSSYANRKTLNDVLSPVASGWHVLDLTNKNAVNFDYKEPSAILGQLNYIIEQKRLTGSEDSRLDYVIIMPTDGGYIDIETPFPIGYKTAVRLDPTESIGIVGKTNIRGLNLLHTFSAEYFVRDFVSYRDYLYISVGKGKIYRYNPVSGLEVMYDNYNAAMYMEVYNDKLYLLGGTAEVYETDGVGFPGTVIGSPGGPQVFFGVKSFNGKLWFGDSTGQLFSWDNSAITNHGGPHVGVGEPIRSIEVYKDQLFFGTGDDIYIYNEDSDTFILSYASTASLFVLKTYQDKLYAGFNGADIIYVYDGESWTTTSLVVPNPLFQSCGDLLGLNGKLYAAVGSTSTPLWEYDIENDEWSLVYDPGTALFWSLGEYQGNLYIGTSDSSPNDAYLYTISFSTSSFSIPNYTGSFFRAPPKRFFSEKRHRYFFVYDRESFVNNVDDKGLVGVGVIPRYLTLVNKEEIPIG